MFGFFLFAVLFVALCLFTAEPAPVPVVDDLPTLEELLTEAEVLTTRPVPSVAAVVAAPVAIARVEVEPVVAKPISEMSSTELRKECSRHGIAWRGVREGKHMLKPDMVTALEEVAALG